MCHIVCNKAEYELQISFETLFLFIKINNVPH